MSTVTVDKDYLERLEALSPILVRLLDEYAPQSEQRFLSKREQKLIHEAQAALKAIPPKPEEQMLVDGYSGDISCDPDGYRCRWTVTKSLYPAVFIGPLCKTEQDAIHAGNIMLREIAAKVGKG